MKTLLFLIAALPLIAMADGTAYHEDILWQPKHKAEKLILQMCHKSKGKEYYTNCISSIMKSNGASKGALAFTQKVEGHSFATDFIATDQVALVFARSFEQDHSETFYLVNGKPQIINVDSVDYFKRLPLEKSMSIELIAAS